MSTTQTYTGQPRTELGTIAARHGRKAGKVPLTISRRGQPSHHLWIDDKSARELDAKVVHLCRVEADGTKYLTLRGEVVKDTLTDKITHIDLVEVAEKGQIKVDVAVRVDARNCAGVKAGGLVEQRLRKIKVMCPADAIPDAVEVDLTDVELMQTVLVEKIKLPKGVTLVTSAKAPLLSVVIPRGMKAEAEAAAAPAA
nr:50S ribosomal protein L25 [Planctomycetota bacterium]